MFDLRCELQKQSLYLQVCEKVKQFIGVNIQTSLKLENIKIARHFAYSVKKLCIKKLRLHLDSSKTIFLQYANSKWTDA